jgi:hypothetical protein
VTQDEDPEFKPQDYKKKRRNKKSELSHNYLKDRISTQRK